MKILAIICRILLGLMFVLSGANILHPFGPMPTPPAHSFWEHFNEALGPSGYMKAIGFFQLLGGLLVLAGAVPLGLCILCPIIVNILIFHLTIAPGIYPGLGAAAFALALIYFYRGSFTGIFNIKAKPTL